MNYQFLFSLLERIGRGKKKVETLVNSGKLLAKIIDCALSLDCELTFPFLYSRLDHLISFHDCLKLYDLNVELGTADIETEFSSSAYFLLILYYFNQCELC